MCRQLPQCWCITPVSVRMCVCVYVGILVYVSYLGSSQQLSDEPNRFQVALSQQQPPLLHGDLHLQLLLLLFLLSPHSLQVPPLFSLPQLLFSLPDPLLLPPLLLLLFLLPQFPRGKKVNHLT